MGKKPLNSGEQGPAAELISGRKKIWRNSIKVLLIVLLLAATGVITHILYQQYQLNLQVDATLSEKNFYKGIDLDGLALGGLSMDQAETEHKKLEPSLREPVDITVTFKNQTWKITQDDLDYTFNTADKLKEAYNIGREGERQDRYNTILNLIKNPASFKTTSTIDDASIQRLVDKITDEIKIEVKDAQVTGFNPGAEEKFTYSEGSNGLAVDEQKLFDSIKTLVTGDKKGTLEVPTNVVKTSVSVDDLKKRTRLIGKYDTTSTNGANGNHNMALALKSANGTILQPGDTFSFNKTTGDSTTGANGYLQAGAIQGGKLIQDYGGGICQAATTIYGAALRAGMEIVQRSPHAWPSSYCPIGLDATISYPYTDMKFKNTTGYPAYIVSWMSGTHLYCEIYGYMPDDYDTITPGSGVSQTIPRPADILNVDPTLQPGEKVKDIDGHTGYKAYSFRVYYKNGVEVKRETLSSSYYHENAAVYRVGPAAADPNTAAPPATPPAA